MDRKTLVRLFKNGMRYPQGSYRFWVQRSFEITVRSNNCVEIDEYESFAAEEGLHLRRLRQVVEKKPAGERFHVGRSILDQKASQVIEHSGTGWQRTPV